MNKYWLILTIKIGEIGYCLSIIELGWDMQSENNAE